MSVLASPGAAGWLQVGLFMALLLAMVWPLGWYMSRVLQRQRCGLDLILGPVERLLYRAAGVDPAQQMDWRRYARCVLAFSVAGFALVYALQRAQAFLPANPLHLGAVEPGSAFNTAVSFMTNTNWQGYSGELTMSNLTQMLALGSQNFLSAACGIAVMAAIARGFAPERTGGLGNFWADVVRVTLYILLPLAAVLALVLVGQGVVQSFGVVEAPTAIPLGPAASQVAIKQLGTNGGGFFNVNSSHPLENPTAFSNLLECLAILIIPAALCWTFGDMVRDRRQGWAVLAAMTVIFVALLVAMVPLEQAANPSLAHLPVDQQLSALQPGGPMEGKEMRFGPVQSSIWATATTAASNGSVNSMHDSFSPLGGMIAMWLMQLGEVVYGGVGSGLYGMLMFVVLAVFVGGLMVGRTPEYLGKKIGPFEMKMATVAILLPCAVVLLGTAAAVLVPDAVASAPNPGPHGFSEILYAFSSASNNNGSAFAGLSANTGFYNSALGVAMFLGRFGVMIPALALAGSLSGRRVSPSSSGTLPTHTPLFVLLVVAVVIVVGALTFVPALALGPIAEQLQAAGGQP
ncbi:MAG: potassium-transporting ATPase subunit KdpA [Phycisphaerales bacterium]